MDRAWLGFAAIVVFALLLVFFFAAVAISPTVATVATVATVSGPAAASQPIVLATVAGGTGAVSASSAPASQTGVGQTPVVTHTIQTGEWLSSVARQYNTTVPAILAANSQITDSDTVRPGQVIRIPTP